MDNDQFGGRTDDDLFADDFEPIAPEDQIPIVTPTAVIPPQAQDVPTQQVKTPTPEPEPVVAPPQTQPPKSLAQSRHNRPEKPSRSNNHSDNQTNNTKSASHLPTEPAPASTPPATAPKAPAAASSTPAKYVSSNTASAVSEARLGSGANPRTKLTEDELAAKMEKMRILNAEKTRRWEQAQADESAHAEVLARSQEEARKRRAEDAAKRRAADEDRRRLEEERAKNRERKLNAMGQKEGGWDEGKEERLMEEDRRGFRGAYGGVRGSRGGGLSGSRYATQEGEDLGDDGYGYGSRGRGHRGRGGRGGRGRGGRGLFDADGERQDRHGGSLSTDSWAARRDKEKAEKLAIKQEDFPALPSSGTTSKKPDAKNFSALSSAGKAPNKLDTAAGPKMPVNLAAEIPLSPPIGKWDEEVAAMDAKMSS